MKKKLTMFAMIVSVASAGIVGCEYSSDELSTAHVADQVGSTQDDGILPAGNQEFAHNKDEIGLADTELPPVQEVSARPEMNVRPAFEAVKGVVEYTNLYPNRSITNVEITPYENNLPYLKVSFDYTGSDPSVTQNGTLCGPIEVKEGHQAFECQINKESPTLETKISISDGSARKDFRFVAGAKALVDLSFAKENTIPGTVAVVVNIARLYTVFDESDGGRLSQGSTCMGDRLSLKTSGSGATITKTRPLTGQSACAFKANLKRDAGHDRYTASYYGYDSNESRSLELTAPLNGQSSTVSEALFEVEDTFQDCSLIPITNTGASTPDWRPAIMGANVTFKAKNVEKITSSDCLVQEMERSDDSVTMGVLNPLVQTDNGYEAMRWNDAGDAVLSCDFSATISEDQPDAGKVVTAKADWFCAK